MHLVDLVAALPPGRDETRLLEHGQVLGDTLAGEGQSVSHRQPRADLEERLPVPVDELGRLDRYTAELSIAEFIARIARASAPSGLMPMQIDFGSYGDDQPVIAVRFPIELAPRVIDFSTAIETVLAGSRVNLANRAGPGERLFLVYPKGRVVGADLAA